MYASQFVELGRVHDVLERPAHPYSKGLLASRPPLRAASRGSRLPSIEGQMPSVPRPQSGCVFAPRCPFAEPACTAGRAADRPSPRPDISRAAGRRMCWTTGRAARWRCIDQPPFRAGDALLNVTRLRKTFAATRGLAAWRMSMAGGRPRLRYQAAEVAAVNGVSLSDLAGRSAGPGRRERLRQIHARPACSAAVAAERRQCRVRRRRSGTGVAQRPQGVPQAGADRVPECRAPR